MSVCDHSARCVFVDTKKSAAQVVKPMFLRKAQRHFRIRNSSNGSTVMEGTEPKPEGLEVSQYKVKLKLET